MRRRNKPKVAWFPQDPESTLVTGATATSNVFNLELSVGRIAGQSNENVTGFVPIVLDATHFPDGSGGINSLSDIENSGYRLRRIVGKCFVGVTQIVDTTAPHTVLCGAAFIVLRTDTFGQPLQTSTQYNLFDIDNSDSPYIWRREWILQNGGAVNENTTAEDWPFTNAEYGSIADGPHIDQKTARIIGKDERLFLVVSCMLPPGAGGSTVGGPIITNFTVTPRILGSMRTTLGNRRNASR